MLQFSSFETIRYQVKLFLTGTKLPLMLYEVDTNQLALLLSSHKRLMLLGAYIY